MWMWFSQSFPPKGLRDIRRTHIYRYRRLRDAMARKWRYWDTNPGLSDAEPGPSGFWCLPRLCEGWMDEWMKHCLYRNGTVHRVFPPLPGMSRDTGHLRVSPVQNPMEEGLSEGNMEDVWTVEI